MVASVFDFSGDSTSSDVKIVLVSLREDKTVDKLPPCAKKLWDKALFPK